MQSPLIRALYFVALFEAEKWSRLRYAIRLHFSASNNAAEYEALINGLRIAIELELRDSTSVVTQN